MPTIAHHHGVSVEMAAQTASVTVGKPKKHSPVTYMRREGKGSLRAAISQPGHGLTSAHYDRSVVFRLYCELRLDRSTRSRVPAGVDCRKEAKSRE